jgi:hypothetical protein
MDPDKPIEEERLYPELSAEERAHVETRRRGSIRSGRCGGSAAPGSAVQRPTLAASPRGARSGRFSRSQTRRGGG